ncbi:MAG: UvrB/UvrC motif-containing protein [Puniceicoccales bacterium]|nr:UvrB/UvrC motif-containing protein [Puniceicoccales bacterium]
MNMAGELPKCHICGGQAQLRLLRCLYGTSIYMEVCTACIQRYDMSMEDDLTKLWEYSDKRLYEPMKACSCCGMTLKEFLLSKRIGCATCLEEFSDLRSLLENFRKNIQDAGTPCPKNWGENQDYIFNLVVSEFVSYDRDTLSFLKSQLKRAVYKEQFETAAILRDRIRQLEEKHS